MAQNNIKSLENDLWESADALREGSRELSAVWGYNSSLADNLDTVTLECSVTSGLHEGTGQLILYYYFNNTSGVEDEQDSIF